MLADPDLAPEPDPRLDRVLAAVSLHTHFQPIYSLTHNRMVGHEALVRPVDRADGAPVAPLALFDRCPDARTRMRLDRAVRLQHLRAYGGGAPGEWLFLNALPSAFGPDGGWTADIAARDLSRLGVRPQKVVVEVLESALPDDPAIDQTIRALRELGCLVALDDFGAGHSNFDRVFRLQPEIVKLDRSVVVRAEVEPHALRIVSQMVSLLHECGCLVLMEGIETAEGADTALRCDVDLVQGYHFGRPAPGLAGLPGGPAALDAAWERFDRQSLADDRAWQLEMASYRQAIELASVLLASGVEQPFACQRFLARPGALFCYLLDARGCQVGPLSVAAGYAPEAADGAGRFAPLLDTRDARWSRRPYFRRAARYPQTAQVTRPYLTLQGRGMCVTISIQFELAGQPVVLCGDVAVNEPGRSRR